MPITPSLAQSTVFLACLGNGNDGDRWLDGNTNTGGVGLTYRLPSDGVDMSGTLWQASPVAGATNTYTFASLGSIANPTHEFLDGSPDNSVSLDSDGTGQSAQWTLEVVKTPVDFYPHQPWGHPVPVVQSYTFNIKNVHTGTYLNGATGPGGVSLTKDLTLTGTNWLVLVAAWS